MTNYDAVIPVNAQATTVDQDIDLTVSTGEKIGMVAATALAVLVVAFIAVLMGMT
jgi:hypothetical protein